MKANIPDAITIGNLRDRTPPTSDPGTYALILNCSLNKLIQVGRFGHLQLRIGTYVYLGSALGPGGLQARLRHHAKLSERTHWHIDYLRAHAGLVGIWYSADPARREHQWAAAMMAMPGATVAMEGFGASDCDCSSHLFFFRKRPSHRGFERCLRALDRNHSPVAEGAIHLLRSA